MRLVLSSSERLSFSAFILMLCAGIEFTVTLQTALIFLGFGAGFGPAMICALFWKRTTFPGALAGMITGGAMVFIWKYLIAPLGGAFGIYELLPAFVLGLLVIIVVSLLTKAPSDEIVAEFDKMRSTDPID